MTKLKLDTNPNSPKNLLAPWILANTRRFYEHGNGNTYIFGQIILLHILEFADKHHKFMDMFRWMSTSEAAEFFYSEECDPAGEWVMNQFERIIDEASSEKDMSEEQVRKVLEQFYHNWEPLKYGLALK
jgi:hypothetical protein